MFKSFIFSGHNHPHLIPDSDRCWLRDQQRISVPARDTWPGGQCSCGSFPCQCEATARGSSSDPTSSGNLASGRAIDAEPKVNCICNRHVFEAYLSRATTSCGSSYYLDTALHVCMLSCFIGVQFLVTLWTVALRAPLSKGFSRQESWSE